MNQKISTGLGAIILIIISLTAGVFVWKYYQLSQISSVPILVPIKEKQACTMEAKLCPDGTYVSRSGPNCEFTACPGESAVDTSAWQTYRNEKYGFEFKYPKKWFLDNIYLSPQKIEFYEIGSNNASIHFGIYSKDKNIFLNSNNAILDFGDIEWQINNLKRNKEDSNIIINNTEFKKYNLIDNGRYEGDSAGSVILIISPIIKVEGNELFLVFKWEQYPGAKKLETNDPEDFLKIFSTFKFTSETVATGLNKNELEDAVFAAVDLELKNNHENIGWDKKVDITSIDVSQKAAKGKWWAKDAWNWIAWKQDNGKWRVLLDTDGYNCKELEGVPNEYSAFFRDVIYIFDKNKKFCD